MEAVNHFLKIISGVQLQAVVPTAIVRMADMAEEVIGNKMAIDSK